MSTIGGQVGRGGSGEGESEGGITSGYDRCAEV